MNSMLLRINLPKKILNLLLLSILISGNSWLYGTENNLPIKAPQVSGLEGVFNAGQTFLTWTQIPGDNIHYRIYRSDKPIINFNQLSDKMIVATVNDHNGFNWMASTNRKDIRIASQAGKEYEIPNHINFIIKEGDAPLPDGTGLFVYTAKNTQTAFYAVTAIINERENHSLITGKNSLSEGISEKVEPVIPVKQNSQDYVHWTDNEGTEFYPAMSSVPGVPYIFRIKVPEGPGPFCLIGILHGSGAQYNSPDNNRVEQGLPPEIVKDVKIMFDSPNIKVRNGQIKIKGFKMDLLPGGWYGYYNTWGTESENKGDLIDYHARRVLWGLNWAQKMFPIDPERVALEGGSMGGIGVLLIGLKYPQYFSAISSNVPPLGFIGDTIRYLQDHDSAVSRTDVTTLATMRPISPFKYIKDHPETEFPYIEMSGGRTDLVVGFRDKPEFAGLAQELKIGLQLYWRAGGHGGQAARERDKTLPDTRILPEPDLRSFRRNQSFPAIANCTANDDFGTVDIAVPLATRPAYDAPGVGDLVGTINGEINWDRLTIVDEQEHYGITLRLEEWTVKDKATADITPRRVQNFKPSPGSAIECKVSDLNTGAVLLSLSIEPDEHGFLTVENVPLTKTGTRLEMKVAAGTGNNSLNVSKTNKKPKQSKNNMKYGVIPDRSDNSNKIRPLATFSDVKYGPDANNSLDLWLAGSDKPTPLVVFIHGGGFTGGSKSGVDTRMINDCLSSGVSVMSINYRFLTNGVSLSDILHDCARSIQFVRFHAREYNIDPIQIASYGGSAGAGTSLWLAFHPDLADPNNPDPVLRESSRLVAAGALNPQASYKLQEWTSFMGNISFGTILSDTLKNMPKEPINDDSLSVEDDLSILQLASKDDPPVFLFNSFPDGQSNSRKNYVHHPKHVRAIKERCDEVGIPATVFFTQAEPVSTGDFMAIMEHLFFTQFKLSKNKRLPTRSIKPIIL
jgi:acetyl esterase/lipase